MVAVSGDPSIRSTYRVKGGETRTRIFRARVLDARSSRVVVGRESRTTTVVGVPAVGFRYPATGTVSTSFPVAGRRPTGCTCCDSRGHRGVRTRSVSFAPITTKGSVDDALVVIGVG